MSSSSNNNDDNAQQQQPQPQQQQQQETFPAVNPGARPCYSFLLTGQYLYRGRGVCTFGHPVQYRMVGGIQNQPFAVGNPLIGVAARLLLLAPRLVGSFPTPTEPLPDGVYNIIVGVCSAAIMAFLNNVVPFFGFAPAAPPMVPLFGFAPAAPPDDEESDSDPSPPTRRRRMN